jgi:hypothetical protein
MLRNTLFISLFVVGSISLLYGGNGWSRPSNVASSNSESKNAPAVGSSSVEKENVLDQYEPYKNELSTYLKTLKLDNITTKFDLRAYLNLNVNSDIHDKSKFPLFNAYIGELQSRNDLKKWREVQAALQETMDQFLKIKETSLLDEEKKDEYIEIDNLG